MDPYFATLSEDGLRSLADMHRGACDDGGLDPTELSWTIVEMRTSLLVGCMPDGDWKGWLDDEIADAEGDRASDWPDADGEDEVREPIVVTHVDGTRLIWDGWHRTAAAIVRGDATIPTILGVMRKDLIRG